MRTPGVPPTRTGTDSTPRHAPISKRRYDREARVLGLRNETVTREVLTDLLTIDDPLPHPRPHAGGRYARLHRADAAQPDVNGMEAVRGPLGPNLGPTPAIGDHGAPGWDRGGSYED
jgi:hypothetical protein